MYYNAISGGYDELHGEEQRRKLGKARASSTFPFLLILDVAAFAVPVNICVVIIIEYISFEVSEVRFSAPEEIAHCSLTFLFYCIAQRVCDDFTQSLLC